MSLPTALSAVEAIDALGAGRMTALGLTQAYLERIASAADSHAWLYVDGANALDAAHRSDQRRARGEAYHPLDGVPVGISDNIDVAGMPATAGMATRRRHIAQEDAYCIAKLRRTGAVILGKLNLDEAGYGSTGDNPHFGGVRHPLDPALASGGAASGTAHAVAATMCAFAIATDCLASMRVPAAWCGIAAFKPSHSRVSQRGLVTVSHRLDQAGPVARSAADLAMVFQQISGADALDAHSRTVPLAHIEHAPELLRVGVIGELAALGVDTAIGERFDQVCERLRTLLPNQQTIGFNDYDFAHKRSAALLLCSAEMNLTHADDLATRADGFSPALRELLAVAATASAVDLAGAEQRLDIARLKARRVFSQVDVLLAPTTPVTAFAFGTTPPEHAADLASFANFAGLPALTLPMGNVHGLPAGLQLIGPRGADLQILALAERIEKVLQS